MVATPLKPAYKKIAREYILSLKTGVVPDGDRPDFGPYDTAVLNVERVFMKTKGDTVKVTEAIEALSRQDKAFADLMKPSHSVRNQARDYILSLKQGKMPLADDRPESFGQWEAIILDLEHHYWDVNGDAAIMHRTIENLCKSNKTLAELLASPARVEVNTSTIFPELPPSVKANEAQADLASPWLNEYIAFSKKWSPRGYDGYHEAIGIALLSTVAARRVAYPFGELEYTPLYTALVGHSTLFKKTTTTRLYYSLLHKAGLDWLLGANITTPQKLLADMAGKTVPSNYDEMKPEDKEIIRLRLAFAAQRGWYYDEFGLHLDQMVKENGVMADFKGLLRVLYDCKPTFENATRTHGNEKIEKPYLSLLASLTPADIKPYAQKQNKFWRDGLFARFTFVCPPQDAKSTRARFPDEQMVHPSTLITPIRNWHNRLGLPEVNIITKTNKQGDVIGYTIERAKDLREHICTCSSEIIKNCIYAYDDALSDIVESQGIPEALYSSYGRFTQVALRVAMLLASLENHDCIEQRHWAGGQRYAEARRRDLHELYGQVNSGTDNETNPIEDAIYDFLECKPDKELTASAIKQNITITEVRRLNSKQITELCETMARAGRIHKHAPGPKQTAPRFSCPTEPLQG